MQESLNEILQFVDTLGDINHQIAVASEEQSVVAEEIDRKVIGIQDKADNTFANSTSLTESSHRLQSMATQLQDKLSMYKI